MIAVSFKMVYFRDRHNRKRSLETNIRSWGCVEYLASHPCRQVGSLAMTFGWVGKRHTRILAEGVWRPRMREGVRKCPWLASGSSRWRRMMRAGLAGRWQPSGPIHWRFLHRPNWAATVRELLSLLIQKRCFSPVKSSWCFEGWYISMRRIKYFGAQTVRMRWRSVFLIVWETITFAEGCYPIKICKKPAHRCFDTCVVQRWRRNFFGTQQLVQRFKI